ncbi:unnamed protein product [Trichobilharzia szidati]|nr:unnamed protein product [Trichobilharzia szidati]
MALWIHLSQSRTVHFHADEEIPAGTKIGSLLKHVYGGFTNLNFFKISSLDDFSELFSVDQINGDILVAKQLDRETLCRPDVLNSQKTVSKELKEGWNSQVNQYTNCELYFSVNCLNVTPIKNLGNQNKSRTPVSNKLVTIFDVVVELRDINDNGCKFVPSSEQVIRIREDSPIHETRLPLNTPYDPDDAVLGNTVKSDLVWIHDRPSNLSSLDNRNINATFKLHSLSSSNYANIKLELELIRALDYESRQNYTFEIVADDGFPSGGHQCHLNVTVLVEDCNDHMPVFDQSTYVANVSEDTIIGQTIVKVTANDADHGENGKVLYSIDSYTDNTDDSNLFYIHEDTGEIRLQRRLNHRLKPQHVLKVFAKNPDNTLSRNMKSLQTQSKSSTAQVIVNVIDTNDHHPRIRILSPTGSKSLEIIEESPPGQDIGILDVSDGDTGKNAEVNCKLTNQTLSDALILTPMNAGLVSNDLTISNKKYKLSLLKSIDREEYPAIEFTVYCWDHGNPPLSSNTTQNIKVIDINDNDPVFNQSVYTVKILEDTSPDRARENFEIISLIATDKDEGRNAKLHFSIVQTTPISQVDLVTINPVTGWIHSLGNLDRELSDRFSILVLCSDDGEQSKRSTSAQVDVTILDFNDNAPVFSKPSYDFYLSENNLIGELIGSFYVTDNDIGENSELEIRIKKSVISRKPNAKQLSILPDLNQKKYIEYIPKFQLVSKRVNASSSTSRKAYYEIKLYTNSVINRESLIEESTTIPETPSDFKSVRYMGTTLKVDHYVKSINNSLFTPNIVLTIQAQDKGVPKLSENVLVRIHILDVNDNSPYFIFPDPTDVNKSQAVVSYKEPLGYAFTQTLMITAINKLCIRDPC